ncbi:unnamed protein product [Kuraishia capsulata CBS 1993]|uniref:Transcription initiation factor IIF subunit alpha n=1 Tax=Kuraishia capsulata CBS 1993 TaxID=1382522 RepID=W6MIB8_9ASCO|nr:uncharacterized protein KUCA_T00002165001 [Kuraishia capsulata CBS 1993]CDK26194.1 unnamed protein product [Kuraishia capsulata CBS 1993]
MSAQPANPTSVTSSRQHSDFVLKTCTPEDVEQTRYHILKFHSKNKVDPLDSDAFTRPIRLHRKDPKNLQFQLSLKEVEEKKKEKKAADLEKQIKKEEQQQLQQENGSNDVSMMDIDEIPGTVAPDFETEEEKKMRLANEKRLKLLAKREAEQAVVAPDGGARKKKNVFKRKTRQIHMVDEEKRRLRYEEYYPWVLEDYEGKNNWVGSYEAGNSDTYALFVFDKDGFKLVPAEKVYKFTPRNKYATLTLEEAEAKMKDGAQTPRWLMRKMEQEARSGDSVDARFKRPSRLRTVAGSENADKDSDHDELDFDEEFADDEEAPIMDGNDEENKESEKRMKREMLRAANMVKTEEDDDDDLDDLFETKKIDKEGQKLRKALAKNALNEVYESDDEEENPYISESEAESETEVKREPGLESPSQPGSQSHSPEVKEEYSERQSSRSPDLSAPRISVKSYSNGFLVLRAVKTLLAEFPAGEWNPSVRKRSVESEAEPSNKKIKLEAVVEDLTAEEVASIVGDGPIELNALLRAIGPKVHDPANKDRLRVILKANYKLKNKFVYKRA